MYKTISVNLNEHIRCGAGDSVMMNIRTISKLKSYGTQQESSAVEGFVLATSLNTDNTFTYVVRYCTDVLREACNYLVPEDVIGLCCMECGEQSSHIRLGCIKNNVCVPEEECVNLIRGVDSWQTRQ